MSELIESDPETMAAYEDAAIRDGLTSALIDARKAASKSQSDVAESMGTVQSVVSDLESSRSSDIYLGTAQRWARGTDHRLDVALVPRDLPTFAATGLPNVLWAQVHKHSLSPILTALVTERQRPEGRTLHALAISADIPQVLVNAVLTSLCSRGWVNKESSEEGEDLYSLNDSAAYVIGVSLHPKRVEGVLLDVYAKVLNRTTVHTDDSRPETMIEAATSVAKQLRAAAPSNNVLGVGVSIAGVVIPRVTGPVVFAPDLASDDAPWRNVMLEFELQKQIQEQLDDATIRVAVENDANALALLQYWQTGDPSACVILMSGGGIGVGYLANGDIFYGMHHSAGEIGHTALVDHGPDCRVGLDHTGCLETVASVRGIAQQLELDDEYDKLANSLIVANERVRTGEPKAIQAFQQAGVAAGALATILASIVDPARIVLCGDQEIVDERLPAGRLFRDSFAAGWKHAESMSTLYKIPEVSWLTLNHSTSAVAAGAAAMSCFLAHPTKWRPTVAPEEVTIAANQPDLEYA